MEVLEHDDDERLLGGGVKGVEHLSQHPVVAAGDD